MASKYLPAYESSLLRDAGEIYLDLADPRALAYFQKAVDLAERNTTSLRFLAECYSSLGDAYADYRQPFNGRKALEYAQKAVELMEASDFELTEIAKAYHTLAYRYHFEGNQDSFVYWMEKCVSASLKCWEPHHPRIVSGYKCLAEAYRYQVSHYRERILRKKYLDHKKANGGFRFEHQAEEYQTMLSEDEYERCASNAEQRLAECEQIISDLETLNQK